MTKILLIEDEEQHIALVRIRLESKGFEVAAARSGREGAEAAASQKPDLILLDFMLPDMGPEKAIRAIRAAPGAAKTPIVAFTALDRKDIERRKLSGELAGMVPKPYEAEELLEEIERITKNRVL